MAAPKPPAQCRPKFLVERIKMKKLRATMMLKITAQIGQDSKLLRVSPSKAAELMRKGVPATFGTRAYEYINRQRDSKMVLHDPMLVAVIDDKHPDGGLLHLFSDHSSLVIIYDEPKN
jgi:hypothetical protein